MIAAHSAGGIAWDALAASFCPPTKSVLPDPAAARTYRSQLQDFHRFEDSVR
jgi:hypothetical protein